MATYYSTNTRRLCSGILDLPPSCIEFVPQETKTPEPAPSDHYFVVGTYHLQESTSAEPALVAGDEHDDEEKPSPPPKPQERDGSLNLFSVQDKTLALVQRLPYPAGILDLHFIPNHQIFAVASSTGCISFYRITSLQASEPDVSRQSIKHMTTHQVFPPDILVLSITWVPTTKPPQIPMLIATLNTGEIHLIRFSNWEFDGYEILNDELPICRHGAEAWIAAICPTLEFVYTGGDDIQLEISSANLKSLNEDPAGEAEFINAGKVRGHEAGITAILPLPFVESRMFLTGSYDDTIRLYTIPSGRPARLLTDLKLGGGVWRLKFLEEHPLAKGAESPLKWRVLASCMHAGAKILELEFDGSKEWNITEVAYVTEHKSMNYASDVQPLVSTSNGGQVDSIEERLVVSTSFYDKLLVVWMYHPNPS